MRTRLFLFICLLAALPRLATAHTENDFVPEAELSAFVAADLFSSTKPIPPDPEALPRPGETQHDVDLRLGPWLDLENGGHALGAPQGKDPNFGTLEHAAKLPAKGDGFLGRGGENGYGTGHMISLILSSASEYARTHNGEVIRVNSIALQNGGFNKGHKSHQNGLDGDFLFMGAQRSESVLNKDGKVTEKFSPQKNWDYWRSIVGQRYARAGRVQSIVGMILVAPEIKKFLCDWTKANNMQGDPLNRAVLQRLYPTAGHDDHFHLRLLCSPYHTKCSGEFTPGKLGCE